MDHMTTHNGDGHAASAERQERRTLMADELGAIAALVRSGGCVGFAVVHLDREHNTEHTIWCGPGVGTGEMIGDVTILQHALLHSVPLR